MQIQVRELKTAAEVMENARIIEARKRLRRQQAPAPTPTPAPIAAIASVPTSSALLHLSHDEYCHILRMRATCTEPVIPVSIQNKITRIIRLASDLYGISSIDLLSERRTSDVVRGRQVICYLCKKLTLKSFPEIGRHLGGRDHTTILHAVRKIERLRSTDDKLNDELTWLEGQLAG